jgi:hypothetical protein
VNGADKGTFALSGPLATPVSPLFLGTDILHHHFTGSIDELRIWNTVRSQAQIQQNMNFRLIGNEAGLVGYYRFDEGTGATAIDATGSGNDGALKNNIDAGVSANPVYVPSGVTLGCR